MLCLLIRANCAVYDRAEIWTYRGAGYRMSMDLRVQNTQENSACHAKYDFVAYKGSKENGVKRAQEYGVKGAQEKESRGTRKRSHWSDGD